MEFSNDNLKKMNVQKIKYNSKYSKYFYGMHEDINTSYNIDTGEIIPFNHNIRCDIDTGQYYDCETGEIFTHKNLLEENMTYYNKSERILNCLNLWTWDFYKENKIMDLIKVNRCYNNRFCPNCRLMDICKFIHKFKDVLEDYVSVKGYKLFMVTLTVPNVPGIELEDTLKKLSVTFSKFNKKFSDIGGTHGYKDRSIIINGGVRILEITYNQLSHEFHPHYHAVVMIKDSIDLGLLEKNIIGKYSTKRLSTDYKSILDCELGLVWSMLWQNVKFNKTNLERLKYIPSNTYLDIDESIKLLQVDFREMDEQGFYEVFKYTFKDTDVPNYNVFYNLEKALDRKRIRQGFGELYNLKCEDVEVGTYQELVLEREESPETLLTKEISELYTIYNDCIKISRFNSIIDDNLL